MFVFTRSTSLLVSLALTPQAAAAAVHTVDVSGGGDFTSIQEAIDASSSGDSISVEAGTYYEVIDFDGKALVIASTGGAEVTTIDGNGDDAHVVTLSGGEGASAVFEGFTLLNGVERGLYLVEAEATLRDLVLRDMGESTDDGTDDGGGADTGDADTGDAEPGDAEPGDGGTGSDDKGCAAAGTQPPTGWLLTLFGLLGLRRGRISRSGPPRGARSDRR